ncbi:MAG TPA: Hint domain-containing protein [Archangium sp.]
MKKTLVAVAGAVILSGCCIARGTLVSTPRGKRPIEDLVEGDTVWCVDPLTGEQVASPLVQVRSSKREIMRLEGDDFTLRCTTDHPLYDPVAKDWAAAGDWVLGKRTALLRVEEDQQPRVVEVTSRLVADGVSEVFDLSVEHELHNFVAAGVLVHNKKPVPPQCTTAQGQSVRQDDGCTLPDGGAGFIDCDENSTTQQTGVCR